MKCNVSRYEMIEAPKSCKYGLLGWEKLKVPKLNEEEIRALMGGGGIKLLSVDTNIFERYNNGLEHGLLKRLSQFAGTEIRLVLSEIVLLELNDHMVAQSEESQSKLSAAMKAVGGTWNIAKERREALIVELLGEKSSKDVVQIRLENFLKETAGEVVKASGFADIDELIARYFGERAPFANTEEKKHEFPDAMALISLEKRALSEGTKMLVVSSDKGWQHFASESVALICVSDLGVALSYFQTIPAVVSRDIARRLRAGELAELDHAIRDELIRFIDGMDMYVEAAAAYRYEEEILNRRLVEVRYEAEPLVVPIEQDDGVIDLEIALDVDVSVTCNFEFYVEDWVDKDDVHIGSLEATRTVPMQFSVAVSIHGDPEADFDVEGAEVVQWDRTVDFGEVEPDRGEADDD